MLEETIEGNKSEILNKDKLLSSYTDQLKQQRTELIAKNKSLSMFKDEKKNVKELTKQLEKLTISLVSKHAEYKNLKEKFTEQK